MAEGLRERKKRQTRQRISDVALGLFVERGFDRVTIAEVAAAAEVSVNTLYNYYEAKEDLVLPPDQASPQRLADIVRARQPGESAARAVLAHLRDELRRRDRTLGLTAGFGPVFHMMRAAPTLTARLEDLGRQMTDALATVLAEETGAGLDDPTPRLVASQIGWFHSLVYAEIGQRIVAGEKPDTIAEAVLDLLDLVEGLLSEQALAYATRATRKA
ncbi:MULTISPECIES: TetR/AcrR family transcriptional regulator [unclassified Streptomyces]|uniref:TetR/AcrR family transcriptional regulator n=1 Tax=unclassified Streptomyces TaxID=2593676 RepID=UPI000892425D|nr:MULTISPECIES: TetR/AcrR family transcriptional regulator [unclassified Streptomyces]PBC86551.1 TetR family transcriptional regulator [Streptomyces sp. 2321.6]SDQ80406.1 transcriptional regulator, TetR family [Streptomyces sp. KS_16]SED59518.1 transcriptional regulator, TetR family [Streptomyces sp. 2112.3]SEE02102.1 transcriptional regulator, TetR family [Streptomyces sp. 2133.1]SNC73585.1 DNA-binding transcriptional regulator, AcrR family [Streptomyces sp. 2114.4]